MQPAIEESHAHLISLKNQLISKASMRKTQVLLNHCSCCSQLFDFSGFAGAWWLYKLVFLVFFFSHSFLSGLQSATLFPKKWGGEIFGT